MPEAIRVPLPQWLRDSFGNLMGLGCLDELRVKNVNNGTAYINIVEKSCGRGSLADLETLGFPVVPEVARTLCSPQESSVDVPMRAGDILIHDRLLAPSSNPMTQRALRRVLNLF